MNMIINIFIGFVALLHTWFMVLEMFFWTKPMGLKAFGLKKDFAEASKVLAMNQGLYNGFLVAGLIWALCSQDKTVSIFFLSCVVVAGIFGGMTANPKIFFVQAIPALIPLILIFIRG